MTRAAARRVWGLMYRHLALYRRSWPRLLELAYWPVLQMCIWGFTASFLAARMGSTAMVAGATLLGWKEIPLHLIMFVPALGVLWGTYRLAEASGSPPDVRLSRPLWRAVGSTRSVF